MNIKFITKMIKSLVMSFVDDDVVIRMKKEKITTPEARRFRLLVKKMEDIVKDFDTEGFATPMIEVFEVLPYVIDKELEKNEEARLKINEHLDELKELL